MKVLICSLLLCASIFGQSQTVVVRGDRAQTSAAIVSLGATPLVRSYLAPNDVLATVNERQRRELEANFTVFAASPALIAGTAVPYCPSDIAAAETIGDGWDGPGLGSSVLTYTHNDLITTWGKSAQGNLEDVLVALKTWAALVQVDFVPGKDRLANRNIDIAVEPNSFFSGTPVAWSHYPAPVFPEPIAGDIAINDYYNFGTLRLRGVLVHELGHSLGLVHSIDPTSVMYPYYNGVVFPNANDTYDIQHLYAPRFGVALPPDDPPPPAIDPRDNRGGAAPALTVTIAGPASTSDPDAHISGTISGGSQPYVTTVTTDTGFTAVQTGSTYSLTVPVSSGSTTVYASVRDNRGETATAALSIRRQAGGRSSR